MKNVATETTVRRCVFRPIGFQPIPIYARLRFSPLQPLKSDEIFTICPLLILSGSDRIAPARLFALFNVNVVRFNAISRNRVPEVARWVGRIPSDANSAANASTQCRVIIDTGNKGTRTFPLCAPVSRASTPFAFRGDDGIDKVRGFRACTQGVPLSPSFSLPLPPLSLFLTLSTLNYEFLRGRVPRAIFI